jgi:ABC-2 type transport system ATP-binding protein
MSKIKIPTFLAQGQSDTLFNLNEAVANYEALRKQGTPVKMLWKSDGHSGSPLGNGEDNAGNPEAAYASRAYLEWMDFYLRGIGDAPKLDVSFYRDWVKTEAGKDAAPAVATVPGYPVAADQTYYLSAGNTLVTSAAAVKADAPSFKFTPGAPTSYTETSALDQSQPPSDQEPTFTNFTSAALTQDTDVAGIPTVRLALGGAEAQAGLQGSDPGARLVIFVKLFEIKADNTPVLAHRLISPVRVPDVTKPFTVTLPGIVHRFAKGSKFELRIAASDTAYKNNNLPGNVTVNIDPKSPLALTIPVLGGESAPAPVAAPAGTQSPGAGQQPQVKQEGQQNKAASITTPAKSCKKNRRVVKIHFTGVKKPDRIISRKVTLNGKRLKVNRKAKVFKISLKKRKPGTYRIYVLVKSKKGKVRRTARTYRVC